MLSAHHLRPVTSDHNPARQAFGPAQLRELMPALANKTYFNYGGQGPLPTPSLQAITASWERIQELGPFTSDIWPWLEQATGGLRGALAALCGVPPERLALTENVTSGCVLPLWGLPWQAGDELLISDCEHPGVVAACRELARREKLTISTLPVKALRGELTSSNASVLEALENSLTPTTRLVVLSHLLWNTGQLMPIAAVAQRLGEHPRRPWLLVDAAQSVGSLPLAELGAEAFGAGAASVADIYAFTGHKWCCGPEGLGGVALSERLLNESQPTMGGWRSLANENIAGGSDASSAWHLDARRFEVATSCAPLLAGLTRSLELLEAVAPAPQRLELIQERSNRLWQELGQLPGVHPLLDVPPPAGLVSFTVNGPTPEALVQSLGARRIWLRSLDDPHCVRACTHITTTDAELDQLVTALAELIPQP
ncbi:aminotransferase class V-fold PLP-dependent enzyme [Synechococcus sp. Cruz-9H2]|nr:aminotransferase class V-fold PLP-dependent enzyme [Synechococcus sp. Cruz-9H2]MCP9842975.1 aminotransferase class V-fold PLP-dependent enzyme [Synechococcus sp. Edmonson 11F2]MCP9856000.1 aminotransferase class V-fold PLP-dependent enzyme [Synechococcus sp. Cruz-9C9]MCP9862113.1 aminotransferase class V-fold PLP-dependent enzyme [Synechococcus sp. Cruz-7E5]MCP9869384.1 aminotransferase class V-fold PLP-dependent enzyme [Synechococcus sp. Cruz-7B9]